MEAKPDWKHTYTIKEKDYTAVHVGLGMKGTFSFITPENRKAYETTGDKRYLKTFTRMIVLTNKKNKSTSGFLMTLVPDKAYYESTHFNALRSNYKQWQKGYSGYVFYHTLEGKFINAWKFENGKVIKKVTQTSNDDIDIDMGAKKKAASNFICTTETWVVWHQTCTTVIYSSESFYIDCGDWYYGYSFTTTNCVDDGEGNTGGGGPGTDCEGVVGGSAYYDNCQECVGGSTGKTECTEQQRQIQLLIPSLKSSLTAMGINVSDVVFKYTDNCWANAQCKDGAIEICKNFLNFGYNDQVAIVWHEMYHYYNTIPYSTNKVTLENPVTLTNVPEAYILFLRQKYIDVGYTETQIQACVNQELTYDKISDPNKFLNEINAYQAEMNACVVVSEAYSTERVYSLWLVQQLYNIATQNYNK